MSTRNEIIDIIKRLSVGRSQFIKDTPADIADKWTRILSDVPFWVLDIAADNWDKEDNRWFPQVGQLRAECYKIAGIDGRGSFSSVDQPDALMGEWYELERNFWHERLYFRNDFDALALQFENSGRHNMANKVRMKAENYEYIIRNEHTPTLPDEEPWQLRKDLA